MTRAFAAALALALCAPLPAARASDPGSCGRTYTGAANCLFASNGMPLVFFGNAEVASGEASVHVRVTFDGYPEIVLFECSATGDRFAQCDNGFPDQTTDPGDFPHQIPRLRLRCYVEGTARGTYGCRAGLG